VSLRRIGTLCDRLLQEVDNWAMLIKDVEVVFQTGDADAIAERLDRMEQSLGVLGSKVARRPGSSSHLDRYPRLRSATLRPAGSTWRG